MFKSNMLILIFLIVILAILYFNTTKEHFKTENTFNKKITIEKKENNKLIVNNLTNIIDTINKYIILDNNVNKLQLKINSELSLKLEKQKQYDTEIKTKNSLESEESKIKNEQSTNNSLIISNDRTIRQLRNEINILNNEKIILENNTIETNINIINKEIKDLDDIIIKINNTLPLEDRFKYLLDVYNNPSSKTIKEQKVIKNQIDLLNKRLIEEQQKKTETDNNIKKKNDDISIKNKSINELDEKTRKIKQQMTINEQRLNIINNELIDANTNIAKFMKEIDILTNNILELENEKNQKIRERTNEFNSLNEQLVSYELEELLEDVDKLKETKTFYEKLLTDFKKTRKIEFGELKVKDDDYRKHSLLKNVKDDNKQKNMYYNITNTELKNKLDELCAKKDSIKYGNYMLEKNLNTYCHNTDFEKVCTYDIVNNVLTDNNNNNIYHNNECKKIKPFINKIPYITTKK